MESIESGSHRIRTDKGILPRRDAPRVSDVDYAWVMQTTFVVTVAVGAPLVALASLFVTFDSIADAIPFAVRVGAGVWFLTAIGAYAYDRFARSAT